MSKADRPQDFWLTLVIIVTWTFITIMGMAVTLAVLAAFAKL